MLVKYDTGDFVKICPDSPICWRSDESILLCAWKNFWIPWV